VILIYILQIRINCPDPLSIIMLTTSSSKATFNRQSLACDRRLYFTTVSHWPVLNYFINTQPPQAGADLGQG
jgi:hypothetical protein